MSHFNKSNRDDRGEKLAGGGGFDLSGLHSLDPYHRHEVFLCKKIFLQDIFFEVNFEEN